MTSFWTFYLTVDKTRTNPSTIVAVANIGGWSFGVKKQFGTSILYVKLKTPNQALVQKVKTSFSKIRITAPVRDFDNATFEEKEDSITIIGPISKVEDDKYFIQGDQNQIFEIILKLSKVGKQLFANEKIFPDNPGRRFVQIEFIKP